MVNDRPPRPGSRLARTAWRRRFDLLAAALDALLLAACTAPTPRCSLNLRRVQSRRVQPGGELLERGLDRSELRVHLRVLSLQLATLALERGQCSLHIGTCRVQP